MRLLLLAALVLLAALPAGRVGACATVGKRGTHVAIASETALVIWDEETRTQHFIRRAWFATKTPYFGFLVPTPTRPTLAEAPDELFMRLLRWTKPRVRTKYIIDRPTLSPEDVKRLEEAARGKQTSE